MSICPKNRTSKSHKNMRRANWKMGSINLVKCSKCGSLTLPHRVCKNCGSYNMETIVEISKEA